MEKTTEKQQYDEKQQGEQNFMRCYSTNIDGILCWWWYMQIKARLENVHKMVLLLNEIKALLSLCWLLGWLSKNGGRLHFLAPIGHFILVFIVTKPQRGRGEMKESICLMYTYVYQR